MSNQTIDQILSIFQERGSESYGSESVTQSEHARQAALLAQEAKAPDALVAAALMHDIGHILGQSPLPSSEAVSYDDKHETRGYRWLLEQFGAKVADPVRLHVAAKRYLCTVDPTYASTLSPTSLKSFYDQGGEMNEVEQKKFESETYFQDAILLRRWDDAAKDPTITLPPIEAFSDVLERALCRR